MNQMIKPDLDKNPGFLFRRMQQVSVSLFLDRLRKFGITPLQYTVLRIIRSRPGIDQISVASRAILDTSTVKDIVARLETKGLVVRRTGEQDRRTRSVSLARAGDRLLAAIEPEVRRARKDLLAPLTARDQATLLRLLRTLLAAHEGPPAGPDAAAPWRRSTRSMQED
jgi:DNA-binding MarR family transcriptional regulator